MFWTCLVRDVGLGLDRSLGLQERVAPGVAAAVPA